MSNLRQDCVKATSSDAHSEPMRGARSLRVVGSSAAVERACVRASNRRCLLSPGSKAAMRLFFFALLASAYAAFPTTVLYQSPSGLLLENIAVRPNSKLLITSVMSPTLFSLDPQAKNATLTPVHTFSGPNGTALTGIAEYAPDTYAVVVSVIDSAERAAQLGSVAIWRVDLTCTPPKVARVARLPASHLTNGLSTVPGLPGVVLAAESVLGAVYAINMRNGAVRTLTQDALLLPTPEANLGINGLHVHDKYLYATNAARGTLLRAPVATRPGSVALTGPFTVIGTVPEGSYGFDDFAIDDTGRVWVTVHPGSLSVFTPQKKGSWKEETVVPPGVLVVPTSVALARRKALEGVLYVATVDGKVVMVDTRKKA
ncbi:hypothetical protein MIND_00819500 [Mycena indigotica]|uniref:SMP-30/Gluconolactonase/LRE-like region domain-containing protein n=1 Tax=Mycena indigotica TaxID=2126181 RepID=A0A8H6SJ01_9AGAR|nr:uncharacterized protein MIND_00819500 [Mycena indigotica]KAF7298720.1 hypothetical protein MIND_00819500 [Mycena indigotica]